MKQSTTEELTAILSQHLPDGTIQEQADYLAALLPAMWEAYRLGLNSEWKKLVGSNLSDPLFRPLEFRPFPDDKPRMDPESKQFSVSVLARNEDGYAVGYYNHKRGEWMLCEDALGYAFVQELPGVTFWAYLPDDILSVPALLPEALRLLRDLHGLQNGPPLEKWREEWEETMREVGEFLEKHETE